MKPQRLEQLSDGIFAIVMTILVFELKVPEIVPTAGFTNNLEIWNTLVHNTPHFLSFVLAFAVLFNYWRAHHFFMSVYATNLDMTLTNINAVFLLFVSMIPFSTSLLGKYSNLEMPIIIFSLNVILIGLCLYVMRDYVFRSPTIKNAEVTHAEIVRGTIRTFVPILFAAIAMPLCFYDKTLALTLLTLAVLFNFSHASTSLFNKFIK